MNSSALKTRREFLRTGMVGGALTWSVPAFLHLTLRELDAAQRAAAAIPRSSDEHPILVVIQLAGGNDGLNTVVPYTNDHYYRARPRLALPRKECLPLTPELGLHPDLGPLREAYDHGLLAIVQGVGYPNPNRSHFRSTEIWHTAGDADEYKRHGWLGRYFDHACGGEDAGVGIAVTSRAPQAFAGAEGKGIAFSSPARYQFVGAGDPESATSPQSAFFRDVNAPHADAGSSIGTLPGSSPAAEVSPLAFLERTALDAQVSSDRIRGIMQRASTTTRYPPGRFATDLQTIARLIGGDLPTRVYYASLGGFDTHANQAGAHRRLLGQFSAALAAFLREVKAQRNLDRVAVLVFSEFGRRVGENAGGGTDHGAAAPVFLAGGAIRAGLYGTAPDLAPGALFRGDPRHTVDFRSVYATLLERHLGVDSRPILHRDFPLLGVV